MSAAICQKVSRSPYGPSSLLATDALHLPPFISRKASCADGNASVVLSGGGRTLSIKVHRSVAVTERWLHHINPSNGRLKMLLFRTFVIASLLVALGPWTLAAAEEPTVAQLHQEVQDLRASLDALYRFTEELVRAQVPDGRATLWDLAENGPFFQPNFLSKHYEWCDENDDCRSNADCDIGWQCAQDCICEGMNGPSCSMRAACGRPRSAGTAIASITRRGHRQSDLRRF